MTENTTLPKTATLVGVTEYPGENLARTVVFHIGQCQARSASM